MKKLNGHLLVSLFFLTHCAINAEKPLSFIDNSVDGFIDRMIENKSDKRGFKMYYNRLQEKVKESDQQKQRATRQYLYQVAFNNLEKKHKDWHDQIDLFFSDVRFTVDESFDKVRYDIRYFLVCYGAYEEYLALKMLAEHKDNKLNPREMITVKAEPKKTNDKGQQGFLGKVTFYASNVGNKIAGWFGFSKNTQTA